jgi:hypothetical protein
VLAGGVCCCRDTSNEEQRLAAIRRIDFSWVIEKDAKKAKKAAEADTAQQAWPWQGLMESLQQAQQELSVVIDLIGTVDTCILANSNFSLCECHACNCF